MCPFQIPSHLSPGTKHQKPSTLFRVPLSLPLKPYTGTYKWPYKITARNGPRQRQRVRVLLRIERIEDERKKKTGASEALKRSALEREQRAAAAAGKRYLWYRVLLTRERERERERWNMAQCADSSSRFVEKGRWEGEREKKCAGAYRAKRTATLRIYVRGRWFSGDG